MLDFGQISLIGFGKAREWRLPDKFDSCTDRCALVIQYGLAACQNALASGDHFQIEELRRMTSGNIVHINPYKFLAQMTHRDPWHFADHQINYDIQLKILTSAW